MCFKKDIARIGVLDIEVNDRHVLIKHTQLEEEEEKQTGHCVFYNSIIHHILTVIITVSGVLDIEVKDKHFLLKHTEKKKKNKQDIVLKQWHYFYSNRYHKARFILPVNANAMRI